MPREVLREPNAYLIGGPRVVIDRDDDKAIVWISDKPWGWPDPTREFLNPKSPGVDRYAEALLSRIRVAGEREAERKARLKAAKRRERDENER